jgi:predicted amidohydrolase
MIVNPWGEVVAKLGDEHKEPQIATTEIDFDFFSRVRRKMKLPRGVDIYSGI